MWLALRSILGSLWSHLEQLSLQHAHAELGKMNMYLEPKNMELEIFELGTENGGTKI